MPTADLKRPDSEIHAIIDKPLKKARENLVGKMLSQDPYGNPVEPKSYSNLTTAELGLLVESISLRLHLFKKEYPLFLPHVVKAVMEHPNLARSDRSTMETYCTLFELDWKGDKSVDNREKFLLENFSL